jgi:hypothetical protein
MHTEFWSENLKRRTGSEDNIKRYINETRHADEDWAERGPRNRVMTPRVPKIAPEFLY